jgi:GntR family transcriptional repressor for pyruvate dehydrogenase complex
MKLKHGGRARVASVGLETLLRPLSMYLRLRREGLNTLLEARAVFESSAAKLAATRIDDATLARLAALLERKRHAAARRSVKQAIELDAEFHHLIVKATGNAFLVEIGNSLYDLGRLGRARTSHSADVTEAFLDDHERIYQALRSRDPQAAGRAMDEHMQHIGRHVQQTENTPPKGRKT